MRKRALLAPERQPQPIEAKRHEGALIASQPNRIWGIDSSRTFAREPEGDGCIERFFPTLKGQPFRVRHSGTLEELARAHGESCQICRGQWLVQPLHFRPPRHARQALPALEPAARQFSGNPPQKTGRDMRLKIPPEFHHKDAEISCIYQ